MYSEFLEKKTQTFEMAYSIFKFTINQTQFGHYVVWGNVENIETWWNLKHSRSLIIMLSPNSFTYISWRDANCLESNFRNLIFSQSFRTETQAGRQLRQYTHDWNERRKIKTIWDQWTLWVDLFLPKLANIKLVIDLIVIKSTHWNAVKSNDLNQSRLH